MAWVDFAALRASKTATAAGKNFIFFGERNSRCGCFFKASVVRGTYPLLLGR
jgi:sulfite reductase alpha subunit-like flavoprotein